MGVRNSYQKRSALRHGVNGIGDNVGKSLTNLTGNGRNLNLAVKLPDNLNVARFEPFLVEEQQIVKSLSYANA